MTEAHPYYKIHTLLQLENTWKYAFQETGQLLSDAKGELNIKAARKRKFMLETVVSLLYASCEKQGQKRDADNILMGMPSDALEDYRRNGPVSGLLSR
jgi:hypothetical protein